MQVALIASNKADAKSLRRLLAHCKIEYIYLQNTEPLTTYVSNSDIGKIINIITETTLLEETALIIKW